ncbi:MAG: dihydropteridine reductase [Butyrivibrio sp.]|uniref:dihydropteridine reductase n=1 Tax=Butyrivibrio sp. TaxID=28121 RepID=UPI0025DF683E|nr:dihydropteridine reductase [Butyrivibrio sp.]MCR5771951.1 dihydropteridine reductase [Butyrivibrio sp.]
MNTDKIYAESIANEYAPKDTSKVVALKKLDRKAKFGANVFAYSFGLVMTMLLGIGMCLSMRVIGDGSQISFILGIIIGIIGIIGVGVNYPAYKKLLANGKKKYAFDIMELAKQISEEND